MIWIKWLNKLIYNKIKKNSWKVTAQFWSNRSGVFCELRPNLKSKWRSLLGRFLAVIWLVQEGESVYRKIYFISYLVFIIWSFLYLVATFPNTTLSSITKKTRFTWKNKLEVAYSLIALNSVKICNNSTTWTGPLRTKLTNLSVNWEQRMATLFVNGLMKLKNAANGLQCISNKSVNETRCVVRSIITDFVFWHVVLLKLNKRVSSQPVKKNVNTDNTIIFTQETLCKEIDRYQLY